MEAPAGSRPKKQNRKLGPGVSLAKFGAGKRATYDPRREKERERALNAAKVNKLKKLKRRLGDKLEPSFKLPQARTCMAPPPPPPPTRTLHLCQSWRWRAAGRRQ